MWELDKLRKQRWKRFGIQGLWTLVTNSNFVGFVSGKIYKGPLKQFCVPGLNCYSCPGALGSCPIGAMQALAGSPHYAVSLMVFGFLLGSGDHPIFTPMVSETTNAGAALGSTLLAVLFAFEGWTNVGAIAGEMKRPGRDLPLAIVGGVSIIMAVYFVINMAYLWVLPADQLMNLESPASAVAMQIFGPTGGLLIKIGIIISVIGAANGFLMSGSRVAYQLAEMNTLPMSGALSKLNGNHVPANSILLIGLLGCIYSLSGQFDMMTDLGTFSCWIFYTLTFACVMKLRRTHPELERKYKVPLYPVIPILAILSGLYVVISQLFLSGTKATLLSIGSILITLIGLPVFLAVRKHTAKKAD